MRQHYKVAHGVDRPEADETGSLALTARRISTSESP